MALMVVMMKIQLSRKYSRKNIKLLFGRGCCGRRRRRRLTRFVTGSGTGAVASGTSSARITFKINFQAVFAERTEIFAQSDRNEYSITIGYSYYRLLFFGDDRRVNLYYYIVVIHRIRITDFENTENAREIKRLIRSAR